MIARMREALRRAGAWSFFTPLLGLFLIVAVGPAFLSTQFRDVFVLPKQIPIAVGVLLIWVSAKTVPTRRVMGPVIAGMIVSMGISTFYSVDLPASILGPHQQQFYALLPFLMCVLAYYGTAEATKISPLILTRLVLAGSIPISLYAILQWAGKDEFLAWSIQGGRSGATFGSPIFLGAYLALILPLAWSRGKKGILPLSLAFMGLLAARSRGGLVSGAAGIVLLELIQAEDMDARAAIGIMCLIGFMPLLFFVVHHHSDSDVGRMEVWKVSISAWRSHPWIGWGPDTFALAFRQFMTPRFIAANKHDFIIQMGAHNDILQVLSTMGLLGIVCYGFFLRRALKLAKSNPAILAALVALFIQAKVNPIPLSVLAIAAVLLGSLDRIEVDAYHEPATKSPAAFGAMALSFCLCVVVGRESLAELYQRRGEDARQRGQFLESAQNFNLAAVMNPFDIHYTQKQLDYLWAVFPSFNGQDKANAVRASVIISDRALILHPNDPLAHEIKALAYILESKNTSIKFWREADRELDAAIRLAPNFSGYVNRKEALHRGNI